MSIHIGIDLGTANSKLAYINRRLDPDTEEPEILSIPQYLEGRIYNKRGLPYLPSVVFFDNTAPRALTGVYSARDALLRYPDRTVRSVKREMGRRTLYTVDSLHWMPQSISAILLAKMKRTVEEKLQTKVASATITVPASFSNRQRQATLEAADMVGFDRKKVTLIDEPSAAILHFLVRERGRRTSYIEDQPMNILVFDMGGGTLDVSIIQTQPEQGLLKAQILGRSRYTELAGLDFDLRLAAFLLDMVERHAGSFNGLPDKHRRELYSRLVFRAEDLKKILAARLNEAFVYVDQLSEKQDILIEMDPVDTFIQLGEEYIEMPPLALSWRQHFERVWAEFLTDLPERESRSSIFEPIKSALREAFPTADDPRSYVNIVLFHGGTCQLKFIRTLVERYFAEVEPTPRMFETPDLMASVAYGAAIYDTLRGRERSRSFGGIRIEPQPIFESIFVDWNGLQMLIPQSAVSGQSGEIIVEAPRGYPAHIPINLYHGFRADDPFLALEQEYVIELQRPLAAGIPIHLGWEVLPNRNINYWWRLAEGSRQPLAERFGRSKRKEDHSVLLSKQREQINVLEVE